MMIFPNEKLDRDIITEIQDQHPDFAVRVDYGTPGCLYRYAVVQLTDHQYTMFMLRWGAYF